MSNTPTPQLLLETARFSVVRCCRPLPDGTLDTREIIEHPGAVTILPLTDDGRVCLIRNNRFAVRETLIELPAGTLEPGEDPAAAARRELAEETGYQAAQLERLCEFWMSPGILRERMHLFLASGLSAGPRSLDAGEMIEPLVVSWAEAIRLVQTGQIQDAKTLVGLLYYDRIYEAAKSE